MSWKVFSNFMRNKWIWIGCLVLLAYLSPYVIYGEATHIRVHDNLDSNIVWYKVLAESGNIFTLHDVQLPYAINGLPRSALPSAFDAVVWLYVLFEPMTAYTISQTIMRFAAFFGMYLLLTRFVLKEETSPWIKVGVPLTFAMLPYWPSGALSIAGLPLALYAFLLIRKYQKAAPKHAWVLLGLIPFFSNFILTFVFFLALMGVLWLIDRIRYRQWNWPFFTAIAGMTAVYVINNYLLITSMFFDATFNSHREELELGFNDFHRSYELGWENFLYGHTHDEAQQAYIIVPLMLLALWIAMMKRQQPKLLMTLLLTNLLLSFWYAFWYWEGWRLIKDNVSIANTFNFARVHFLDPPIWYIIFALALVILWKQLKFGKLLAVILIILQCLWLFSLTEEFKYRVVGTPSFEEFYSEELFAEIRDYIGEPQDSYRVVSIGMHPTIAQFNGFYTLDTYNNSFPLEYKHAFREVIAGELEKSSELADYFDNWGGRLYMYVADHGKNYMFTKDRNEPIEQLDINTEALQALGGEYIFSAVEIKNAEDLGLELADTFTQEESPWEIYLYQVANQGQGT
ncbi:DUF6044 family protein [Gracilibacillus alcaliphilus]|uniref:DUF6044 family protein n=1 Tax=Gracilibacillus alcaliphilus TaxID=1401441 RepID=UPI001956DC36|nr:DUF6044 family protein [Gracilibacillus alcaliphilus]MBM7679424.1 hypothetical protein [Gracilibacillus alcaliphilus]